MVAVSAVAQSIYPDKNQKGKWGYVNDHGDKVIDYKYDEAGYFDDGVATVKKGDSYGVINTDGKEVISVKYNLIEPHSKTIYRVAADGKVKDGVLMDEKYGFISKEGKVLLKPEYEEIGTFNNGLAYIKKGNLYGYINDNIDVIIPCKYNAIGTFNNDGFVWAAEGAKYDKNSSKFTGGKLGVFNREGKVIVPIKYKAMGYYTPAKTDITSKHFQSLHFNHRTVMKEGNSHSLITPHHIKQINLSAMPDSVKGFYGSPNLQATKNAIFTTSGDLLLKDGHKYDFVYYPTDGFALVRENKAKYNYMNIATGKLLLKNPLHNGWGFNNGIAIISRDGNSHELMNTEGESVSSPYKYIFPEKDGHFIVKSDATGNVLLYGVINRKGNVVIPANHTFIYPLSEGKMACCTNDGKAGFKDLSGNWVIDNLTNAYSFKDGLALVKKEGGWGLIDSSGKEVVGCKWKTCKIGDYAKHDRIWVSDDDSDDAAFSLIRVSDDQPVTTEKFKWVRDFGSDFDDAAIVGNDSKNVGIITKEGKLIVPPLFSVEQARQAYGYLKENPGKEWGEFDTYRVKLYDNPKRNKGKLTSKLESSLWDY